MSDATVAAIPAFLAPPTLEAVLNGETDALIFATLSAVLAMILASVIRAVTSGTVKPAMKADEFQRFALAEKEIVSHDTRRFTFALQTPTTKLGLPVGQHITLRFTDADGKNHQRSYTPISGDETPGSVTFVIKVYKPLPPKFPAGGKMSQHLDSLKIGDTIDMKGPKGHMTYHGRGKFTVKQMRKPLQQREARHFCMIAGGTGITPCLQVIHAILRDAKDKSTTVSLLYANQTEDDILVREELESIFREHPDRFTTLHYTLDRPPANWSHSKGFITKDMISRCLPKPASDGTAQILMCGPPPMLKFACIPALEELGYTDNDYFCF